MWAEVVAYFIPLIEHLKMQDVWERMFLLIVGHTLQHMGSLIVIYCCEASVSFTYSICFGSFTCMYCPLFKKLRKECLGLTSISDPLAIIIFFIFLL